MTSTAISFTAQELFNVAVRYSSELENKRKQEDRASVIYSMKKAATDGAFFTTVPIRKMDYKLMDELHAAEFSMSIEGQYNNMYKISWEAI